MGRHGSANIGIHCSRLSSCRGSSAAAPCRPTVDLFGRPLHAVLDEQAQRRVHLGVGQVVLVPQHNQPARAPGGRRDDRVRGETGQEAAERGVKTLDQG